jgi:hypothetical protein
LAEVGLPPLSISMALLFFNVGVEIGRAVMGRSRLSLTQALDRSRPVPADGMVGYRASLGTQVGLHCVYFTQWLK